MGFRIEKYHFKAESILEGLPRNELRLLMEDMERIDVKKGGLLFTEGSVSKGVYLLRKGKVKLYQFNKEGKEQIAYIYREGDLMGHRPLLCEEPHPASACALEDAAFFFFPKQTFLQAMDGSPEFAKRLLVNLAREFSIWINILTVLTQQPVREKVAVLLLILNEKYARDGKEGLPAIINLSRENMANYARISTEALVRVLRGFKDEKIIETKGRKIILLQPKVLEFIAETY